MNKRYYQIKQIAKEKMRSRFGLALLITIVPPIIYGLLGSMAGFILGIISTDLGDIADTLVTGYGTFISISLILQFFRGKTDFTGEDFFFFDDRVLQYFLLSLVFFFLGFTAFIPFYNQLASIADIPASIINNGGVLNDLVRSVTPLQAIASLLIGLLTIFISTRLLFAPYIIIDQHKQVLDAIKISWNYTRGKFWYVFFFPLSFILWYLLIIPTLFLILLYLIPYVAFSITALYMSFKEANGDEEIHTDIEEEVVEVDILDDDLYR